MYRLSHNGNSYSFEVAQLPGRISITADTVGSSRKQYIKDGGHHTLSTLSIGLQTVCCLNQTSVDNIGASVRKSAYHSYRQ